MRYLPLGLLLLSTLHAGWDFDIFAKGTELYDETRDKTIEIYNQTFKTLSDEKPQTQEDRDRTLWRNISPKLDEGLSYLQAREKAPESAWIGEDKSDIQAKMKALFDEMGEVLLSQSWYEDQQRLQSLQSQIAQNEKEIMRLKEAKIGAPVESLIHTTQKGYEEKIAHLQEQNSHLKEEVNGLKHTFSERFAKIGVTLSPQQMDVLLTRIDGKDIIGMTMAMESLKGVMAQLERLMRQEHGFEAAKRYYGMHAVLMEMVVYIQQGYIEKSQRVYMPKVDHIVQEASQMIERTQHLYAQESDPQRKAIYAKNLQALRETLRIAKAYREDLHMAQERVKEAQKIAKANLRVSQNTYHTVMLSSDLYRLLSESRTVFEKVSRIQIPQIVPFENTEVKRKYQEITRKIQ